MNIVLISRTESKLNAVAREIGKNKKSYSKDIERLTFTISEFFLCAFTFSESMYGVKTKTIAVDFGAGREIYNKIEKELTVLDVGVLVNNVGR